MTQNYIINFFPSSHMIYEPNKKTNIKIFSVNELYIYFNIYIISVNEYIYIYIYIAKRRYKQNLLETFYIVTNVTNSHAILR